MYSSFFVLFVVSQSFKVGIANSMQKIKRDFTSINQVKFDDFVLLDLAKDESESFQLVLFSNEDLKNLTIKFSGFSLSEESIQFKYHKVDYVKTGNPTYQVEYVGWWPDVLLPVENLKMPANTVQPIWCSFITTPETKPGTYNGRITLNSGKYEKVISVVLNVRKFTIPRPGSFEAPFGLYKFAIEDWYFGKRGVMSMTDFRRWSEMLGEYRLTPKNIATEFVNIVRNDKKEITDVDMSALNPILLELTEKYFPDYTYEFFRLPSGVTLEKRAKEGKLPSPEELTAPLSKHLYEWYKQGFTEKTYVYGIDEPGSDEIKMYCNEVYRYIKKQNPNLKIMQTGNCNTPELVGAVDIWCPKSNIAWQPFFQERIKDGDKLWQYVCVSPNPPFANFFVDEPGVDHRNLFWQTRKIGASGMLYWTVFWVNKLKNKAFNTENAFPDSPFDFSRSQFYTDEWVHANGDGMLLYPGKNLTPLSSIRLEIIRDGIEDYEYFVILDNLIKEIESIPEYKSKGAQNLLHAARRLTKVPDSIVKSATEYSKNPDLILEYRKSIANMIEQLIDIKENKDYESWLK